MYLIRTALAALVAATLIATPASAAQEVAPSACAPAATPFGAPVTIDGRSGVSSSLPFTLDQPAYAVSWSLAAPSDRLTYMTLEATSGTPVSGSTLVNASGSDPTTGGQTAVYKLKPGTYYLSVRAPAGWSVTFTPIAT